MQFDKLFYCSKSDFAAIHFRGSFLQILPRLFSSHVLHDEGGQSQSVSPTHLFLLFLNLSRPVWDSAQRVGFFNIGSGRVLDKIPGSRSGSGRVGVSKNMIGYFRVSFFLSGISGYFGYFRVCRVFSGISGFTHIY